jgi:hypothetical protein
MKLVLLLAPEWGQDLVLEVVLEWAEVGVGAGVGAGGGADVEVEALVGVGAGDIG